MRKSIERFREENNEINYIFCYFDEINQYYKSSLLAMGMLDREENFSVESSAKDSQRFNYSEVSTGNNVYAIGDKK